MSKTFPEIAHIDEIFDAVGKTISNVQFAPQDIHGDEEIVLEFEDGSLLRIAANSTFTGARFDKL